MFHSLDAVHVVAVRLWAAAVPNPQPAAPPGVGSKADTALGWLKWGGLLACVAGLFIAAGQMALNHRRGMGGAEAASSVGWVVVAVIVIGAAAAIVGAMA